MLYLRSKGFIKLGLLGLVVAIGIDSCAITRTSTSIPIVQASQEITQNTIASPEFKNDEFVDVSNVLPDVLLDIRYATTNNFLGKQIYSKPKCLLRWSAAKRLIKVQQFLKAEGLKLKVFDCYRPPSAQRKMWEIKPDSNYVADPKKGSRHNRGMAVDVSLADENNQELDMGTQFDDFSQKAHRNGQVSPIQAQNRHKLEDAMVQAGFIPLPTEWWHFDALGWEEMPIEDIPL